MIKYNFYILIIFILSLSHFTQAQTLHFSQFHQMEVFYNPATAGLFEGDYRFHAIHRNQYRSIPVPYSSFSAGGDFRPVLLRSMNGGAGIMFNNDQAGDSRFYTRQILVSGSVTKVLDKDSVLQLSAGLQPGLTFMGIDESGLTFENQFQGDRYNPSADPGENFTRLKVILPELNAGLFIRKQKNIRQILGAGLSFQHLTKPKRTLFGQAEQWQSARLNFVFHGVFRLSDKGDLLPEMLIQAQKKYRAYVVGLKYRYWLLPVDGFRTALYAGVHYRIQDATIFTVQMDYRNFTAGISYDVTMSNLKRANNRRGAYEISLVYIFSKPKPFIPQKKFCPVYL